ncbi:MAG TPA: hypothetical protein VLF21_01530 [Candidatus Saccharimonadales bacterium]|nr:hypothetical protein [Candidatus Saccharimonadales bacterium]
MTKYLIFYNASDDARKVMNESTPEQVQASMQKWMAWKDEAEKTAKVEFGLPLQPVERLTPSSTGVNDSQASGYSIIEAESKEALNRLLMSHPHFQRGADATIDVFEMIPLENM